MCGIFGYNGSKRPSLDKIRILGIYNKSRGTDSSGLMVGKEVYKRLGNFNLFLENTEIKQKFETNTVIGHTRKSSSGAINLENAHPFSFVFREQKNFPVAGVHNGTIYNIDEIQEKYKVSTKLKVDSAILIKALIENPKKVGNILKDYRGNAALLINDTREKNTLWVFKGASKNYESATALVEERPLYMWVKSENEKYFSSMKDSLQAIGAKEKEIEDLPTNVLMKFKDGKIEKEIKVDRSDSFRIQKTNYSYSYSNNHDSNYNSNSNSNSSKKYVGPREDEIKDSVKTELYNDAAKLDRVFMENLRFKTYKYCSVDKQYKKYLLEGTLRLFPDGTYDRGIYKNKKLYYNENSRDYFFYRGIMLHDVLSRKNIIKLNNYLQDEKNKKTLPHGWNPDSFFLRFYSYFSEYPYVLYGEELTDRSLYQFSYQPASADDYFSSILENKTFDEYFEEFLEKVFKKNIGFSSEKRIVFPDLTKSSYEFHMPFARKGFAKFSNGKMNIEDEKSRPNFISLEDEYKDNSNKLNLGSFDQLKEYYEKEKKELNDISEANEQINKILNSFKKANVKKLLDWDVHLFSEKEITFAKECILEYLQDLKAESELNVIASEKYDILSGILDANYPDVFENCPEVEWDEEKIQNLYEKYTFDLTDVEKNKKQKNKNSKIDKEDQEFISETITNFFYETDSFITILEEMCQEYPEILDNEDIMFSYKCLTELNSKKHTVVNEIEGIAEFDIEDINLFEDEEEFEDSKFI